MLMNGARILIEELIKHDVDVVFGYPGGTVINIYDELYQNADRIHHVLTAHEQGAAHAADGYARASGKTGVVIATSGPGATNLVTGIANAHLDSIPLVAITGNVAVPMIGKDSFQEVDIVGVTQPIVKHSFLVRDIKDLQKTLKEAFVIANTGRKGAVLVDIPKSVQMEEIEFETEVSIEPTNWPLKENLQYNEAIEAINSCERPYIYCGGGVISSNAGEDVLALSKKLSAPIGLSMMGLTAIPNDYELNLGMCGMHGKYAASKAQSKCDLLIAIGTRFSDRATGNTQEYRKNCKVIHIDIDNAEINKNVRSEIGLCGDVKNILGKILVDANEKHNSNWIEKVNEYRERDYKEETNDFIPQNIIETVNGYFKEDTVVATDVGQHQMWTAQHYKFQKPRTLLTSGGLGTMGFGLGAAIGGCVASGCKPTVLFTGDGSFGMNLNELATAVSQQLPVVVVILNNGVLGMVKQWQNMFFDKRYAETILNRKTNFPKLSEAFGGYGYKVTSIDELKNTLENLKFDGPTVIDCHINQEIKVLPMIPPGATIKDIVMKE